MKKLKAIALSVLMFLASIGAVFAAPEALVYTDNKGTQLRLTMEICQSEAAVAQLQAHGVPVAIAVEAVAAEVLDKGKVYVACWVMHPSGTVWAVAPDIGPGLIQVPAESFIEEKKI